MSASAAARRRFLEPGRLPSACSRHCRLRSTVTVEANPEHRDAGRSPASACRAGRRPCLDRRTVAASEFGYPGNAQPSPAQADDVRRADLSLFVMLLEFDNDLARVYIYGIPGQKPADLEARSRRGAPGARARAHLRVRAGRRSRAISAFTHAHGAELERAGRGDGELFRAASSRSRSRQDAGYRWYETANYLPAQRRGTTRAAIYGRGTTSAYWATGATTSGSVSARSAQSKKSRRWRNARSSAREVSCARPWRRASPPHAGATRRLPAEAARDRAQVMLGLRLDEPLPLDRAAVRSSTRTRSNGSSGMGLAELARRVADADPSGRGCLGGSVTAGSHRNLCRLRLPTRRPTISSTIARNSPAL